MNNNRQYLLIGGNLYLISGECEGTPPGNRYPCPMGRWAGYQSELPPGTLRAANGDTVALFGNRYEVNALPVHGDCEDEIDLELVLLCEQGDPEAESAAYDDHLSSLGSHILAISKAKGEEPCTACNAASLVACALDILNPDDCTLSNVMQGDCGTVTFDVLSDDCGAYRARVTVEIMEA